MNQQFVRDEVEAFRQRGGYGRSVDDCFPAWYLHHRYRVAASDAVAQSAEGVDGVRRNNDFGLDAFHVLEEQDDVRTLVLIQAKFRDDLGSLSAALRDLERSLPRVAEALTVAQSGVVRENRVLVSLRQRLRGMSEEARAALRLRFEVIHLSDADDLALRASTRRAYDDLRQALTAEEFWEGWRHEIDLIGPAKMGGAVPPPPKPPQIWHQIDLDAVPLTVRYADREVTMYSGIGRLADLVELYNQRRSDLFAKNVRFFLAGKQNVERGPAGKIRDALRETCIVKRGVVPTEPELFAFHHNGITVFARDVVRSETGRIQRIRDPYVLNGCQTVRSAYDFRYDARHGKSIDEDRWQRVCVPVRIITSQQEELIRQITISNNRQNQIPPSALRANDEIQLDLEQRLQRAGIFYERQKGALDELERSNSSRFQLYARTNGRAVAIDDLARCLAAAAGEFDLAHSPSHIFEYDAAYTKTFAPERLSSVHLLVLLQNLHDVLPVVLKNDLGLVQSHPKAPRRSRLVYYTLCLLMRYLAKNRMEGWVGLYGSELLGKEKGLRNAVASELSNYKSHIKKALNEHFLTLEETRADTLRDAFRKAAWSLALRDTIDVFATFSGIDERIAVQDG